MNSNFERRSDFDLRDVDWKQPKLLLIVPIALIVFAAYSSIYTVQAESQGVVTRFGRYLKTVNPGLRFKMPFGIDHVDIVPVRRQMKQEFGFGTEGATNDYQFSNEQELERSMVTGDLNAAIVENLDCGQRCLFLRFPRSRHEYLIKQRAALTPSFQPIFFPSA